MEWIIGLGLIVAYFLFENERQHRKNAKREAEAFKAWAQRAEERAEAADEQIRRNDATWQLAVDSLAAQVIAAQVMAARNESRHE